MSYFWFQIAGGEDAWNEALSEHREKILRDRKPAFVTVLDAHTSPDPEWGREDYAKMKYSGPLYFDFDGESLDETIPQFQKFLTNLQDMGVNLRSLRLYATGGRGFHIEVPAPVFMAKVPKTGVTGLPYAYREMAMEMVVDTLDMRVYTGRRGRMWRTTGVQRSNGKYKVPLSAAEAMSMTSELFDEVCAHCVTDEPLRDLPELNMALAAMFIKAQGKVEDGIKRRSKGTVDLDLLARHKGQFPPTVEKILRGECLAPGVGFHKLAMQLAITANALGKTADQLVEAGEGLCKTHSGDSSRYGSPRKRKEELRRMHDYTRDNPCYGYSRGGIRSLVDVDTPTGDLDGVSANAGVGMVAEEEDDNLPDEVVSDITSGQASLIEGLMITKSGVHKRTAEGAKTISNIGFRKPSVLIDLEDRTVLGIEVDVLCDSKALGRKMVTQNDFLSRANLSKVCSVYGGIFSGSDTQAGVVGMLLKRAAEGKGRVVYTVHREGLDVVQNPLINDRSVKDVVWVHPDIVISDNPEAQYAYKPALSNSPEFCADVHMAEQIKDTPETREWLGHLLNINTPEVVSLMLGWYVACFHRQFYHLAYNQFPLLHPNGLAGSGKTQTALLLSKLFFLTKEPAYVACGSTTAHALKIKLSASASIPCILDEYKPSELGHLKTDMLLQSFRLAYNQGIGATGGISKGNASGSFRDVTHYTFSTPIVFLAEAQEMQTAIVQRTIPVSFSQDGTTAHTASYNKANAGKKHMPELGRLLLKYAYRETVESRQEEMDPIIEALRAQFPKNVHDRQVFNLAVVIGGLNFLDRALREVFGNSFSPSIAVLRNSIYEHKEEMNAVVMSEPAKALNDITMISRTESEESEFYIKEGREYIVLNGHVDVLMRETFVKYFAWCKRKGFNPLYTNADSFSVAMGKFSATVDKTCMTSPLKTSGQSRVFRFNLDKLTAEGIEMFQTKSK